VAAQTVTTTVNYDDAAISGLLNGETITINGGELRINGDMRWNQQAAVVGNMTCSATLGGNIYVDGTEVWEIAFDASTGNVPTQAALGSNGVTGGTSGATGELTRVWATGSLTPATAGGAMPASGYIKLRSKTGTFQDNEIITLPGGATVTVNSATGGKRSWIHCVGTNSLTVTLNRLNKFTAQGDWYYLGETNGTDDQTFQFPVTDNCPAIQIETSAGSGVYEWWLNAQRRWGTATQYIATDVRGKYFGIDAATGVITIARRATDACGYKPASGCKVRIPNLIFSNSSSTDWNANTQPLIVANRYEFLTTGQGEVYIDKGLFHWYLNLSNTYNLKFLNSAFNRYMLITSPSSSFEIANSANGCDGSEAYTSGATTNNLAGISITSALVGGSITNCRLTQSNNNNGGHVLGVATAADVIISGCQFDIFGGADSVDRNNATNHCVSLGYSKNITFENNAIVGSSVSLAGIQSSVFKNTKYCDKLIGTTNATFPARSYAVQLGSSNIVIDDITFFENLADVNPYSAYVTTNQSSDIKIRNIGSKANVLTNGSTFAAASIVTVSECRDVQIQRAYVSSVRTAAITSTPTSSNIYCYDIRSGYSSTYPMTTFFNVKNRGIQATSTIGTTTGSSGVIWSDGYTAATTGVIRIAATEPTAFTVGEAVLTLASGSKGGWAGSAAVSLPSLNDTVEWTMPYFALGHTGFGATAPVFFGTNASTNFTYTFQYDIGSGWNGTWLTLNNANLTAITINSAVGIKLKVKAVCSVAAAANAITFISLPTTSTTTAQLEEQPWIPDAAIAIDNIIAGSRIQIYNLTTSTEIVNEVASGTSYAFNYVNGDEFSVGDDVRIRIARLGYLPSTLLATATVTGFGATANQLTDTIYNDNGINGSTVTEFIADYPNVQVDISDPDETTTVQRVYAWLRYVETTEDGIAQWFDAVDPTDDVNYEINTAILDLKLDNTQATPVVIGGGRLYRSDGATIIATASSSIQMDPNRVYQTESAAIAADVWAYATRTLTSASAPTTADIWSYSTRTLTADPGPTAVQIADTVLRRSTANVEASGTGDAVSLKSLYGMIAQGVHNTQVSNATLTVTKSDDTTVLGTRTVTTNSEAQPIVGIDSD